MNNKIAENLPPNFAKRYQRIVNGEEKLNTTTRLKNFWLFASKNGWLYPESREGIARAVYEASLLDPQINLVIYASSDLRQALDLWECHISIDHTPYPDEETDQDYRDRIWGGIGYCVRNAKVSDR